MEHERGTFKVNLEITPLDRQKELQRLNLRPNPFPVGRDAAKNLCR
jgi:hypothetical protein